MSKWVVHCKKQRHDVYVGRPSPYGNPFKEGADGTRAEVIRLFEDWLLRQPELLEDVRTNLRSSNKPSCSRSRSRRVKRSDRL
jgi:hypothetical protein